MASAPRVAVVGGGIAGSLCASVLRQHGAEPVIFDAGRRSLGGRLGTLRGAALRAPSSDWGAQFFCVADDGSRFAQVLRFLEQGGLVERWTGRFGALGSRGGGFLPKEVIDSTTLSGMRRGEEGAIHTGGDFCGFLGGGQGARLYVGVPSMASVCEGLRRLGGIDARRARVTDMRLDERGFWGILAEGADGPTMEGGFHALVVASHSPATAAVAVNSVVGQATDAELSGRLRMLGASLQELRDRHKAPAYTLSATFPASVSPPFDAVALPTSEHLRLIVRDASRPGRSAEDGGSWTAVSTSGFAAELLATGASEELAAGALAGHLRELLQSASSAGVPAPTAVAAKCWRAGFTAKTLGLKENAIGLEPWRLAISGDFISDHSSPLEAAVLSGMEAGERAAAWFS
mmetsp:Transcript_34147/g.96984  ORF Transcript_34147/g.96984 Transcript_34147/m.96984 type:complete len:404 (-) Transcript_34147:48-1259(-)